MKIFFINLLLLLVFYEIRAILGILRRAENPNDWFSRRIYMAINKIALYFMGSAIVIFITSILLINNIDMIILNGYEVSPFPLYPDLNTYILLVTLFIVAQIYKAGITIREEQELTI